MHNLSLLIATGSIGFLYGNILAPIKRAIIQIILLNIIFLIFTCLYTEVTNILLLGLLIAVLMQLIGIYLTRKFYVSERNCFDEY